MLLKTLSLTNFRNYSKASFTFSPQTTLVVGPNTSGKTNLLEAIYFLAIGKSFRATYDREVIRDSENSAQVKALLHLEGVRKALEATIVALENGENTSSKRFKINGVKKRLADFAGNLRVVYFGPEEIELVTGPPSRRRKYLDTVLTQIDREYARTLLEYEKVLRQRNRLLLLIREGEQSRSQLDFWDEKLRTLSRILRGARANLVTQLNRNLDRNLGSKLQIVYQSRRSHVGIHDLREREIAAGKTLWGPHRDDFRFLASSPRGTPSSTRDGNESNSDKSIGLGLPGVHSPASAGCVFRQACARTSPELISAAELDSDLAVYGSRGEPRKTRDLAVYGSRGEQRLAVLHLKLAELEFISERVGERPILLLDDIFSELDKGNRQQVLSLLGRQQTIITSTEADVLNSKRKAQSSKMFRILNL